MADATVCEYIDRCPFFNDRMKALPSVGELMKARYCTGDKTLCARYQVKMMGRAVPTDLYPHQLERVPTLGHEEKSDL